MNAKKLQGLNVSAHNVIFTGFPYCYLSDKNLTITANRVIFLGNDLRGLFAVTKENPKINKDIFFNEYIGKVNECLDYVRKNCKGCELYYKPHPVLPGARLTGDISSDEKDHLDLTGFKIIDERDNAEIYYWKNIDKIRYVFSISSWATVSAYNHGFNSYLFFELFKPIFGDYLSTGYVDYFPGMPPNFFIKDLRSPLIENKLALSKGLFAETEFLNDIKDRDKIWFVISSTEYITIFVALSKLIKSKFPDKKIGLIVAEHNRWKFIDFAAFSGYFDDIHFFPRNFYSINFKKLWKALKIAGNIRNFKIDKNDAIVLASSGEFLENCFISFFKKNKKIAILLDRDYNAHYNMNNLTYSANSSFHFTKGSYFYNKIFEPLLGLYKTLFLYIEHQESFYICRFEKPLNEIYDSVYILRSPPLLPKNEN